MVHQNWTLAYLSIKDQILTLPTTASLEKWTWKALHYPQCNIQASGCGVPGSSWCLPSLLSLVFHHASCAILFQAHCLKCSPPCPPLHHASCCLPLSLGTDSSLPGMFFFVLLKLTLVSMTHPAHFLSEELSELRCPLGKEVAVSLDGSYLSLSCHHRSLPWVGGSSGSVLSV